MKLSQLCPLLSLVAIGLSPVTIHAQAISMILEASATTRGFGFDTIDGETKTFTDVVSSVPIDHSLSASGFYSDANTSASASVSAHAQVGDLGIKVFGGAAANNGVSTQSGTATCSASGSVSWQDSTTLLSDALPELTATIVTWSLLLDGDVFAQAGGSGPNGFGVASATVDISDIGESAGSFPDAPYQGGLWGRAFSNFFENSVEEIPGGIVVKTVIVAGRPTDIGFALHLRGSAESDAQIPWSDSFASFNADVSGSLHWGGIQSVTDTDGNVIPRDHWTIVSESGFDYSKPFVREVPEPSTANQFVVTILCALFITPPLSRPSREEKAGKKR